VADLHVGDLEAQRQRVELERDVAEPPEEVEAPQGRGEPEDDLTGLDIRRRVDQREPGERRATPFASSMLVRGRRPTIPMSCCTASSSSSATNVARSASSAPSPPRSMTTLIESTS
jgi:hypothetical protein